MAFNTDFDYEAHREHLRAFEAERAEQIREADQRRRKKLKPLRWRDARNRTYDAFAAQVANDLTAHPLRRLRVAEGLTLAELSAESKVSPRTIQAIERRERQPQDATMKRLSKALRVSVAEISE